MEMLDSKNELCGYKFGLAFIEELELVQVPGEVTILAILGHHEEMQGSLDKDYKVLNYLESKEELKNVGMTVFRA